MLKAKVGDEDIKTALYVGACGPAGTRMETGRFEGGRTGDYQAV